MSVATTLPAGRCRSYWMPTTGSHEAKVMKFMREHGEHGYDGAINSITEDYQLIQGEAGPHHADCPFTQATLDRIDIAVQEIVQSAVDRYDDWVSDALP